MATTNGSSSSRPTTTPTAAAAATVLDGMKAVLGEALVKHICTESRILLVGAGGIGCEVLKNLALTGFAYVHVIDLDTIDVSNLNRQLLFRSQHVGMPKCDVACDVASKLAIAAPGDREVRYVPHHGNVCDAAFFNVSFVKGFDLILNALDNVAARRRVNRIALAAEVPLVEAGTTGYLGQVNTIDRASGVACYECKTQERPKVFPICTIRSTPSMPVHTIVWAKELWKLLFHPRIQESMLFEDDGKGNDDRPHDPSAFERNHREGDSETDFLEPNTTRDGWGNHPDNAQPNQNQNNDRNPNNPAVEVNGNAAGDGGGGSNEPSTYMKVVRAYRHARSKVYDGKRDNIPKPSGETERRCRATARAQDIIRALYVDEIQKQLDMDRYKTAAKMPHVLEDTILKRGVTTSNAPPSQSKTYRTTDVWTPTECVAELVACIVEALLKKDEIAVLEAFDKDDDLAMRFVAASSNLRNHVFGITPLQSLYDAKGIAGNIVPAIATTNAICAGLQVLQAFHILKRQFETKSRACGGLRGCCRYLNCMREMTRNGLYVTAAVLEPPNPLCFVCGERGVTLHLSLNVHNFTLRDLLRLIVKQDLAFQEPSILIEGDCIWEEGDGADTETYGPNLQKKLPDLPCGGIRNGTMILIEDFSQDLSVNVAITHRDTWDVATTGEDKAKTGDGAEAEAAEAAAETLTEEDTTFKFVIVGRKPLAKASAGAENDAGAGDAGAGDDDDDDVVEVVNEPPAKGGSGTTAKASLKRPPEEDEQEDDEDDDVAIVRPPKKAKATNDAAADAVPNDVEVIAVDDD